MFQWAHNGTGANDRIRYAWTAANIGALSPSWVSSSPSTGFWATHSATHETCPPNYRRFNDGSISAQISGFITGSELRQSLYLNPQRGTDNSIFSAVWGYYADGYFDRRKITNTTGAAETTSVSATGVNSHQVAHIGRLYYNPTTHAHIFLPAVGYRDGSTGSA